MTMPEFIESYSRADGSRTVMVGTEEVADLATVLATYPAFLEPSAAVQLARLVTHFARGDAYRVVTDPEAFERAYLERLASEEAETPWQQGRVRLVDHGVPDFGEIHAPRRNAAGLEFFVTRANSLLPYRVVAEVVDNAPGEPRYDPVPLAPAERPREPRPADVTE